MADPTGDRRLDVSVVTPEANVWSGEADFVIARAADGDLGIMPGHAAFLGVLHHARLIVHHGNDQTYIAVHGGFIEVLDNKVSVLTKVAEAAPDIDLDQAKRDKAEAEEALRHGDSAEHRAKLMRASARLQTAAEAGILGIG